MPLPPRSSNASASLPRARKWINWCGKGWSRIRMWGITSESSKLQAPSSRETSNPNLQVGVWLLELLKMFDDLNDLYQQVILDHCKQPRNFREMPSPTFSAQGHNPLCGDQLKLFLAMDGDVIKEISFVGTGCCISKASASLLTESLKGKK